MILQKISTFVLIYLNDEYYKYLSFFYSKIKSFNYRKSLAMKSKQNFFFSFLLSLFFLIIAHTSQAQYGYGAGGYGYGRGYGRSAIPDAGANTPRKEESFDPEKVATEETRWMTKKLKLTEEQIPKIETININYAFKRMDFNEEVKKLQPPFTEEMRVKVREKALAIREKRNKAIKAVLTEEQYQTFLKKKENY